MTRANRPIYPHFTAIGIRNSPPRAQPYKLAAGLGMYLRFINPNGSRWWRFKYRFAGKEKLLALGRGREGESGEGKRLEPSRMAARKLLAQQMEHEFLMKNMDVTFTAEGASATTLLFKFVLVGRPLVEQLQTDGKFLQRYREAGFEEVIVEDRFGKGWTFTF